MVGLVTLATHLLQAHGLRGEVYELVLLGSCSPGKKSGSVASIASCLTPTLNPKADDSNNLKLKNRIGAHVLIKGVL